jgi:flagellar motor protein MotB
MAAGGGGAWKVAYADFVTAMMAFFLVMWIVSLDQKIKEAIAHYFSDPYGYEAVGKSRASVDLGILAETRVAGTVPDTKALAVGRGRRDYTEATERNQATQLVAGWFQSDGAAFELWLGKTKDLRDTVKRLSPEYNSDEVTEAAIPILTRMLSEDFETHVPIKTPGIYRDMLLHTMKSVDWRHIAEDLLTY